MWYSKIGLSEINPRRIGCVSRRTFANVRRQDYFSQDYCYLLKLDSTSLIRLLVLFAI